MLKIVHLQVETEGDRSLNTVEIATYILKSQVRHSTVIITDFNTQGTCVTDALQILTG